MERGLQKVNEGLVYRIVDFFSDRGIEGIKRDELLELSYVSNGKVPINKLSLQHKLLIAKFANMDLDTVQLKQFHELLREVRHDK